MTTKEKIESVSKQIDAIEKNLNLIQEKKAEFVLPTDIPLTLTRGEGELKKQLEELQAQKAELEKQLAQEEELEKRKKIVPSPAEKKLKVYISSTSEDLKQYRGVTRSVILEADWIPLMRDNFDAKTEYSVAACEKQVEESDLVILLLAFQFGYAPALGQGGNGNDSITILEWEFARKHNKKTLIFLAEENEHWLVDKDRGGIDNFRKELGRPDGNFEYEESADKESDIFPNFRKLVGTVLNSYKEELLRKQAPPISTGSLENFRVASARLQSRHCIPFLGSGVYGQGPLSTCALRKALGDESCRHCDHESCQKSSLATVAEFYYPSSERNDLFLPELKKIIDDQVKEATIPPVYDLVKQIKPRLIVSTTLDLLLETTLWNEGKQRCLILCHTIRPKDKKKGTPKGILIFEGPRDTSPKVCPANEISVLVEEGKKTYEDETRAYIVYKPLGSPQLFSPKIDTVVITEEDYQILLQLLGSTESGMPAAFTTYFRDYPPIFLGYPMDVWHYRLMGQFFKSVSLTDNVKFAVGPAEMPLEQKAWKGLGVNLIPMDLSEFSQKVKEALP